MKTQIATAAIAFLFLASHLFAATVTTSIGQGTGHDQSVDITGTGGGGPYTVTLAGAGTGVVNGDALWDEHATPRKYLITAGGGTASLTVRDAAGVGSAPDSSGTSTAQIKRYYNGSTPITNWEAALDNTNLYASADVSVGECYDDSAFDESVTINGGSTVGLNSITLTVPEAERHDGTAGSGARIVRTGGGFGNATASVDTTISWLEVDFNDNTAGQNEFDNVSAVMAAQNMILHNSATTAIGVQGVLSLDKGASGSNFSNNIIYDITRNRTNGNGMRAIININADNNTHTFNNNTVYKVKALNAGSTENIQGIIPGDRTNNSVTNNISVDTTTAGSGSAVDFFTHSNPTYSYNLSSDATASGTGSLTSKTSANQFVSTTGGSEDLHLKSGADAIDAGTDLGTTPSGVEIDIDGRDRDTNGDTWDMGADEFVAVGAPSFKPRVILIGEREQRVTRPTTESLATFAGGATRVTRN